MTNIQIFLTVLSVVILIWSYFDYYKWKALGQGGVPDNLKGWLMVGYRNGLGRIASISRSIYSSQNLYVYLCA